MYALFLLLHEGKIPVKVKENVPGLKIEEGAGIFILNFFDMNCHGEVVYSQLMHK
jgi:hypothetical protein